MARLTHPEALEPGDQARVTASVEYSRPVPGGTWSSSLTWGRTHNTATLRNLNAYLAETVLPVSRRNFLTGRLEWVGKDELFDGEQLFAGDVFRVTAYTFGYTRDLAWFRHVETGIGANFTWYGVPGAIQPYYGAHPVGGNIFLRLRLRP